MKPSMGATQPVGAVNSVNRALAGAAAAAMLLTAGCGGGGGTAVPTVTTPVPSPTPVTIVPGMVFGQPVYADGDTAQGGQGSPTADGIPCDNAAIGYHIHAELMLYQYGQQVAIPKAIGIMNPTPPQSGVVYGGSCFYHIHTHDASGIIHVEAPSQSSYTVGQFFNIWGMPLDASRVATFNGPVTVFVNGAQYGGDPRGIIFSEREVIALEVGTPIVTPPQIIFDPQY